jgi:hypothetical protein
MPATIDTRKKISAHFRSVIARSSQPFAALAPPGRQRREIAGLTANRSAGSPADFRQF